MKARIAGHKGPQVVLSGASLMGSPGCPVLAFFWLGRDSKLSQLVDSTFACGVAPHTLCASQVVTRAAPRALFRFLHQSRKNVVSDG
jgi:hypothetical protein